MFLQSFSLSSYPAGQMRIAHSSPMQARQASANLSLFSLHDRLWVNDKEVAKVTGISTLKASVDITEKWFGFANQAMHSRWFCFGPSRMRNQHDSDAGRTSELGMGDGGGPVPATRRFDS